MASATSASNYFFTEPHAERLNERKESTASSVSNKSIDNPLLGRDPPSIVTTSTKDIISTTYNNNELRHRRPSPSVIFREDKENVQINPSVLNNGTSTKSFHGAIPPPPRASISLGTALEGPLGVVSSNAAYRPPNRSIVSRKFCVPEESFVAWYLILFSVNTRCEFIDEPRAGLNHGAKSRPHCPQLLGPWVWLCNRRTVPGVATALLSVWTRCGSLWFVSTRSFQLDRHPVCE